MLFPALVLISIWAEVTNKGRRPVKPKSLLDRSFRYTPGFATNVNKTFEKARREMRQAKTDSPEVVATDGRKVVAIGFKKAAR